jgi:hypothetical protein
MTNTTTATSKQINYALSLLDDAGSEISNLITELQKKG